MNGELEPERTGGVIHCSQTEEEEGRRPCTRIATMLLDEVRRGAARDSLPASHAALFINRTGRRGIGGNRDGNARLRDKKELLWIKLNAMDE